jgi:putative ABC transport system permease protein
MKTLLLAGESASPRSLPVGQALSPANPRLPRSRSGLALAVGRFFTPVLYGVSPKDPATYALSLLLMAGIGAIACLVPAQRALGIEATVALREE